MQQLTLDLSTTNTVFGAAVLIRGLTYLHVNQAMPGWLQEWKTGMQKVLSPAFPHLQQCSVHTRAAEQVAATDLEPFLRSIAGGSLEDLSICTGGRVTVDTAAMSHLARCDRLRWLFISTGMRTRMDWTDAALFAAFTKGCLSRLNCITLERVRLSKASVVAIASAAPRPRQY